MAPQRANRANHSWWSKAGPQQAHGVEILNPLAIGDVALSAGRGSRSAGTATNNSLAPTSIPAASGCNTGKSSVLFLRLVAILSFRFCRRTPKGAKKSKLPIEIAADGDVITKLYATLDPCLSSGFSIEHQCRRGLWLSSDRPLHHAPTPGSLPFCLAQASCMLTGPNPDCGYVLAS